MSESQQFNASPQLEDDTSSREQDTMIWTVSAEYAKERMD